MFESDTPAIFDYIVWTKRDDGLFETYISKGSLIYPTKIVYTKQVHKIPNSFTLSNQGYFTPDDNGQYYFKLKYTDIDKIVPYLDSDPACVDEKIELYKTYATQIGLFKKNKSK